MGIDLKTTALLALAGVVLALGLLSGGHGAEREAGPAFDDGGPLYPESYRSCRGKPSAGIGHVEARIVERPSPDRAVIEATWTKGHRGLGHALELVLPEAAWMVEGDPLVRLPPLERTGAMRWTVGFETGRDLDVVLRCAAVTEGDDLPSTCETYVRLAGPSRP